MDDAHKPASEDPETQESSATRPGTDESSGNGASSDSAATPARRVSGRIVGRSAVLIVIIVLAAVVGWLAWGYYSDGGDPQNDAVAAVGPSDAESGTGTGPAVPAVEAAKAGAEEMFSYEHGTVEKQLDEASNDMTGDFRKSFRNYVKTQVVPSAKEGEVTVKATAAGAAPVRFGGDSASVMVFLNQVANSNAGPKAAFTPSRLMMSMKEVDGRWLINDVNTI